MTTFVGLIIGVVIGVGLSWLYDWVRATWFLSSRSDQVGEIVRPEITPPPLPVVDTVGIKLEKDAPTPACFAPPPPPEKTVAQKIADTTLPLAERLNLRYEFAEAKYSEKLQLLSWKNYAGKRMQAPLANDSLSRWKRACTLIEDSIFDVKTVK